VIVLVQPVGHHMRIDNHLNTSCAADYFMRSLFFAFLLRLVRPMVADTFIYPLIISCKDAQLPGASEEWASMTVSCWNELVQTARQSSVG